MFRFILKICIFLVPVGLVLAFPAAVYLFGREGYSVETTLRAQAADENVIAGKAYGDNDLTGRYYKTMLVQEKKPEIITIGSSKTLEMRKEFFAKPDTFVNAAYGGQTTEKLGNFIAALPENGPKMIIIGLDQRFFRAETVIPPVTVDNTTLARAFVNFISYDWRKIYLDYARGRFTFSDLLKASMRTRDIGLVALIDGDGYRGDGSYRYHRILADQNRKQNFVQYVDSQIAALMSNRYSSEEYGHQVSPTAIASIDKTLALAAERHIQVVGYIPPHVPSLNAAMLSVHDEYRDSVIALPKELGAVFAKHGFKMFDFTDATSLGGSDEEFLGDNHTTDKLDLRMLIYMARNDKALLPFVDIKKAQALLKKYPGDFLPLEGPLE